MDMIQPFGAVLLVMALLGGALFALKRRGAVTLRGGGLKRLEVMERVSLGPHHALHLVRAGDRCVLIATAPSSCQLLDVVVAAEGRS
jgi:flagellar biogenesis protein FliO